MTQQATETHYAQFHTARRFLEAVGLKVERTKYNYSLYFVHEGNKTTICERWHVVEMAEKRGMK